jgi:hypothetical protein
MALPSSGSISLGQVNTELGASATATRSLGEATTRTLFGVASGAISMSDGYGKANQFAFTISSNTNDANLATLATAAGWNGSSKVVATIGSGIYISGTSTGTPALTVSGSFPGGVELINNGTIVGRGGNGGNGGLGTRYGGSGGAGGGPALSVSTAITITNNSVIAGGGGGGGGGASDYRFGGGGGGGRSSLTNSSGGSAAGPASAGGAGTISAAGAGGNPWGSWDFYGGYERGGYGGSGGTWGASGSGGSYATGASPAPGSGGGSGSAVSGNSNITWVATGTRYGAIA